MKQPIANKPGSHNKLLKITLVQHSNEASCCVSSSLAADSLEPRNTPLRAAPNRQVQLSLTFMKLLYNALLLTFLLVSCDSRQAPPEMKQIEDKNDSDNKSIAVLANSLDGLWISDNYLNSIEKNKSIYASRNYETKIQGFYLGKTTLLTDSALLEGFTSHEGGYNSPLRYDNEKGMFINNIAKLSDYSVFPDPFELNYNVKGKIDMYFPETNITDTYRKVDADFQTEIRRILIAGTYKAIGDNSEIQFDKNGSVNHFKDYKYYEIIADFGEGITYDAIAFFKTLNGGNWSDGEIYKFEISSNNLHLQLVKTNWETKEHEISTEILVLELQ